MLEGLYSLSTCICVVFEQLSREEVNTNAMAWSSGLASNVFAGISKISYVSSAYNTSLIVQTKPFSS